MDSLIAAQLSITAGEMIERLGGLVTVELRTLTGTSSGDPWGADIAWVAGESQFFTAEVGSAGNRMMFNQGWQDASQQSIFIISTLNCVETLDELANEFALLSRSSVDGTTRTKPELLVDGQVATVEAIQKDRLAQVLVVSYVVSRATTGL
jgi:hypothetical protein